MSQFNTVDVIEMSHLWRLDERDKGKILTSILGKTPVNISISSLRSEISNFSGGEIEEEGDAILFEFSDGTACLFYHGQNCCESVDIEDITGDWSDLLGNPLLVAEEKTNQEESEDEFRRETWTFYTFRGIGGSVDVRWYGKSNGYYSEAVDMAIYSPRPVIEEAAS